MLEFGIVDLRDDALESQRTAYECRNDIGLIGIREAEQQVRVLGVRFAQDGRLTAISVDEPAIELM